MKLTSILCMCYCLIISTVALSQTKTVPISNMISNFSKSETKNTPMQSIDGFEVDAVVVNKDLLPFSEPKIDLEYDKIKCSLLYTPSPNAPLRRTLTLVQVEGENGINFMNELVDKYGKNSKGVPAIWYSGKVNVLLCPLNMFGEIVSREKAVLTISKGIVISQENVPIKKGSIEKKSQKAMMLDGCWYDSMRYNDLGLLEEFANQDTVKSSIKTFALSLLIVTDNQGKESGHILFPQKIEKQEEKILINNLLKRINQLPPWSFGWLETINGSIFQGRYLKVDYSQNTGWRFKDYFH